MARVTDSSYETMTGTTLASGDILYGVDVSDTADDATGSSKQIPLSALLAWVQDNYTVYSTVSTTGSITTADYVFASNTITLTLPSAATRKRPITIKNVGTGVITVKPPGAETVDGVTQIDMSVEKQAYTFVPDGTNWQLI